MTAQLARLKNNAQNVRGRFSDGFCVILTARTSS